MMEESIDALRDPIEEGPTLSITPAMKEDMRISARWAQIVAILGMTINGLFGTIMLIVAGVMCYLLPDISQEMEFLRILGLGYAVLGFFALFYIYVSILLYRYSEKLSTYVQSSTQHSFELFFQHQERFWKFFGGSVIVYLIVNIGAVLVVGIFFA